MAAQEEPADALCTSTVFKGAYVLRRPADWLAPGEAGVDFGPWTEAFTSRAPATGLLLVTRKARFASLTGASDDSAAARLGRFIDASECAAAYEGGGVAAYDGSRDLAFAAAAAAAYAAGPHSRTQAVLLEAAEEDLILRLVGGAAAAVDFFAVVASCAPAPQGPVCACCGRAPAAKTALLRCARCRSALYCSRACQTCHWKLGHRASCRLPLIAR